MITDWKLDMMGKEIIKQIFGEKKEAIELACQTIKDSYRADKKGGSTSLPIIISNIDKLKKKKEILLEMRTDGEIDKEEYTTQKQKIDSEIQTLQSQYNEETSKIDTTEKPDLCWDKIMETINSITDENGNQHELIRNLVDRIVPDGKWRFKWYLNLEGENNAEVCMRVDGKKNHAVVAIEEGATKASSVTYGDTLTNRDNYDIITLSSIREHKKTSPHATLHRRCPGGQ